MTEQLTVLIVINGLAFFTGYLLGSWLERDKSKKFRDAADNYIRDLERRLNVKT